MQHFEHRAEPRLAAAGVPNASTSAVSLLRSARADLARIDALVTTVYKLAVHKGGLVAAGAPVVLPLGRLMLVRGDALAGVLRAIGRRDAARAAAARTQTKLGAAIAMLLLLSAFAYFYWRSVAAHESVERLAGEKEALLGVSRSEARTDALTGLRNRRALTSDLTSAISELSDSEELLLVMYDLDGDGPEHQHRITRSTRSTRGVTKGEHEGVLSGRVPWVDR